MMEEEIKKEESQEKKQVPEKSLEKMTAKELREIAREIPGVTGVHAMRKEQLLAVVKEAREIKEEGPAEKIEKETDELKERQVPERPLEKMTAKELREIAREIPGVSGVHAMKKEELLAIIKRSRGIKDEKPGKRKRKKTTKPMLSVKELKKKITQLRGQKQTAREARDRRKVDILRRRINRLKKQTRKFAHA